MTKPLVRVENLKVHFPINQGFFWQQQTGWVKAVDGLDFAIAPGETLGLVGESGCGKSTTGRALLQMDRPTSGKVFFNDTDLTALQGEDLRRQRQQMQMIFQDPYASLNPRMTVGEIVGEPLEVHHLVDGKEKRDRVLQLLEKVGLSAEQYHRYPYEFSGGQRQRIVIARALAANPAFIICDEPIAALDVSIQAQVINLLMDLQQKLGLAYLFIAHDLAVVRHIARRVGVMYLGRIVEMADSTELFARPRHPYSQALLSAAPLPDPAQERVRQRIVLEGEVPSPDRVYSGCPFADRCRRVEADCRSSPPRLEGSAHQVACFHAD